MSELDKLGFTINLKISILEPTQKIIFIGLFSEILSVLTDKKKLNSIIMSENTVGKICSYYDICRLVSLVVHAFNAIYEGPMHYRNIERYCQRK